MALDERSQAAPGREQSAQAGVRVSRWTRVSISAQVLLVIGMSVGAAVLAIDASAWAPLRWRADLTVRGRNTLDPALDQLLAQLPGRARIETFLQPLPGALEPLWIEARTRTMDVLSLAARVHPGTIELVQRELDGLEAMRSRLLELGLREQGGNVIVVELGERRELLRLFGDFTILNQSTTELPTIAEHRAGLALAEAVSAVSLAGAPRVLFSSGHGEPSIVGTGSLELDALRRTLESDGFEVEGIDLGAVSEVPADAEVLAIVAATDPLGEAALARVRRWLDSGGRLLVVVGNTWRPGDPEDAAQLLTELGIETQPGLVCQPVADSLGGLLDGLPEVSYLRVAQNGLYAQHPITKPLYDARRSVLVHNTRSFKRGAPRGDTLLLDLMRTTSPYAWTDLPRGGRYDWTHDATREDSGPFSLAMSAQFTPPEAPAISELAEGEEIREARAVSLASAEILANENFDTNRDFALNLFNWLAQRDFRLSVSIRDPDEGRIDLRRGTALVWVNRIGVWGLSGLCIALGLFTWRRRRA